MKNTFQSCQTLLHEQHANSTTWLLDSGFRMSGVNQALRLYPVDRMTVLSTYLPLVMSLSPAIE